MDEYEALKSIAVDVSKEFMAMPYQEFHNFLQGKLDEAVLILKYQLTGDYGEDTANLSRLGKFLDHTPPGQKRFAIGRGNAKDYQVHLDEFTSGIIWENPAAKTE